MSKPNSLTRGMQLIANYAKTLPNNAGVYRMIDADGGVLYVGKAKNLPKRVMQYTQINRLPTRLKRMVSATHTMEFMVTRSEVEALLLEANLIKKLQPKYNVALKDDKSYPLVLITTDHDFPQLVYHRGPRNREGRYYGPFASGGALYQTLEVLHKAFQLRNCNDHYFAQCKRPCLQYHIKRCTAPCVGYVSKEDYAHQVESTEKYLSGKSSEVQADLARQMEAASDAREFEQAAALRDRIRALTYLQTKQMAVLPDGDDMDVIAFHQMGGRSAVEVFFYRGGASYGNRSLFPKHEADTDADEIFISTIMQFYADKIPPPKILLNRELREQDLLEAALTSRAGHRVVINVPQRGAKTDIMAAAEMNAKSALARHVAGKAQQETMRSDIAELLGLGAPPQRIEVYDNSHLSGQFAVGAMIVAGPLGFEKKHYRKFNIKTVKDMRDDYAMMREMLTRRLTRLQQELAEGSAADRPDLIIIDGGKGQLSAAHGVMTEMGIEDIAIISMAKGADRDAGREWIHQPDREPFQLSENDPRLAFLQRLRDEAHRFAIGAHRLRRGNAIRSNSMDDIPGIGAARRKALLHHFGSARAVQQAGVDDLQKVSGISAAMAQKIYDYFQS
ncbi:MAG TPA: excinuclease ABC subunit C [Rhodospirillaceae bacterium]|nr:excinuclease ABC subunit C [Rhodospirillaceae bacterium]